jgi:hypothetical protein
VFFYFQNFSLENASFLMSGFSEDLYPLGPVLKRKASMQKDIPGTRAIPL